MIAAFVLLALTACSGETATEASSTSAFTPADFAVEADAAPYVYRPIDRIAPTFTLVNQDGVVVGLEDLRGSWVGMDWVFTNCATFCPLLTGDMSDVRDGLGEAVGDAVHFVTITFDPTRDTVAALKAFSAQVGADPEQWSWLTGSEAATAEVATAYGISYEPAQDVNGVPQFQHTSLMVMIDPSGRERHRYLGTGWADDAVDRLTAELANPAAPIEDNDVVADDPPDGAPPTAEEAAAAADFDFMQGVIVLPWEDWELTDGVTRQDLYQFPNKGQRATFVEHHFDVANEVDEAHRQALSAMDVVFYELSENSWVSVGYTLNLAMVVEADTPANALNALYVVDSEWCCSTPG